ncbi:lys-63-specific deubiquitinase BRCC36 isoform X7 [Ovis aries]|uniref:lys-63-specific deubiquitinase BRCC36 isoform X7 n=1 Tax=Ovis aries TaxID=9940 RepID=UPI0029528C91|nr:lys-63-specific deubiquitinase BRCC36 isoform X7 [Ovis aries]
MAVQVVQAVQAVHLESDAFLVCLNHALSTEKEEVMGLCIGELNDDLRNDPKFTYTGTEMRTVAEKVDTVRIVHIHSVIILRRSDKRKDRVEISPEQLSAASTEAERLAELTGRPMRVVGWYHSHPHITVWPSHVVSGGLQRDSAIHIHVSILPQSPLPSRLPHDMEQIHVLYNVRTQAMYQMMDQGFVGLIFSCFIEDKNTKTGRVLYTCFQSIQAQKSSDLTHLDSVTKIHNGSVFTKNLCSQMSAVSGPLLQWLEDRLEQNQQHVQELQQEKEELLQELSSLE